MYLYVLVRSDLSPGQQLAQTAHAVAEFAHLEPTAHRRWARRSGYLVILAVEDEAALGHYAPDDAVLVREPDLGHCLTAAAFLGGLHWPRLSSLPLAGRPAMVA